MEAGVVRSYAEDLKAILEDPDAATSKAFLKTFIKRIEVDKDRVTVNYTLPVPPERKKAENLPVLPINTFGWEGGNRTPTPCGTGS